MNVCLTEIHLHTESVFAGTAIQAPRTNSRKRAQASPFFFSPFTNFRGAGLSEEQCLCVIVMFHFLSHLIFRVHCCGEAESTGSPFVIQLWTLLPNGSLFRTFVMWNIHGHCSRKGVYYRMVGPHYIPPQRTFMAVEYVVCTKQRF